jgi:hypothetical protein
MNMEINTQTEPAPPVRSTDSFCFRWWYKGRTAEGNILKLEGRVDASDASAACRTVEAIMRAEHPTVRWMQGREIEDACCKFGPTVQKLKKQNDQAHRRRDTEAPSGTETQSRRSVERLVR